MTGGIFISYRRGDGSGFAGRLYDRLAASYTPERIFLDVDNLAPGQDFVDILNQRVDQSAALIALIGAGWADATDAHGRRRLDNPEDFVRIEIETALARNKLVVPVLLDHAEVPAREQLPESLWPLLRRHAARISHESFGIDADRLIRSLHEAVPPDPAPVASEAAGKTGIHATGRRSRGETAPPGPQPARRALLTVPNVLLAVLVAAVVGLGYGVYYLVYPPLTQAERTLSLVETFESEPYREAGAAINARLHALSEANIGLLGANPTPAELDVFYGRIGLEAFKPDGGTMPLADFQKHFDLIAALLNRVGTCVSASLCDRAIAETYFLDYARSFWRYFSAYAEDRRKTGSPSYLTPVETFVAEVTR